MNRAGMAQRLGLLSLALLGTSALAATPSGTVIRNVAYFDSGNGNVVASNEVNLTVAEVCGVSLTPSEQLKTGVAGERSDFLYNLTNTGNAAFTFEISTQADAGTRAELSAERLTLGATESAPVTLSLTPEQAGSARATLTASCSGAQAQATAVLSTTLRPLITVKSVDKAQAQPGDMLTYTLSVTNPNSVPAQAVIITDTLQAGSSYQSSTPTAQMQEQTLSWNIGQLAAGETRSVSVTVKLPDLDNQTVSNTAITRALLTPEQPSNTVTTTVWAPQIGITKTALQPTIAIGEYAGYSIKVTNNSKNAVLDPSHLTDQLPEGLSLDAASVQLNGKPATDLNPDPQILELDTGTLRPGQSATVTYRALVTPAASQSTLRNVAYASARSAVGSARVVHTAEVDAIVVVRSQNDTTLIGRVYLDNNGNGLFDAGDQPVKGARLTLSGVGNVLTDAQGRYGVNHLRSGMYGVALDPRTSSGLSTLTPGSYLQPMTRMVNAFMLTTADFPVQPPQAQAQASRTTTIRAAGLLITKSAHELQPGKLQVTTTIHNDSRQTYQLSYEDRLPRNSQWEAGAHSYAGTVLPGQTLTLQATILTQDLSPEQWMTDPTISATRSVNP